MSNKLKLEFPAQGWKQLLTSRREMLDAFDRARNKSRAHETETFHGRVAEAEFRKWLSAFLPKRYGVTPGYIVSPGLKGTERTPHFDVIIYDQLESPVLWIEDSPDVAAQGRSLAIPVEYVHSVLEVKAGLSSTTMGEAIEHLADLMPMMAGPDEPDEKYKLHLPARFCCGLVFFDLKQSNQFSEMALSKILGGLKLRGFFGGVVLRGEGHEKDLTGRMHMFGSDTAVEGSIGKNAESLLASGMTSTIEVADGFHVMAMMMWAESYFAQFGFDILAMMQGKYDPGRVSSWHGLGRS